MRVFASLLRYKPRTGFNKRENAVVCLRNHKNIAGLIFADRLLIGRANAEVGGNASGANADAGNQYITDKLNLKQICSSRNSQRDAGCNNAEITVFYQIFISGYIDNMIKQIVRVFFSSTIIGITPQERFIWRCTLGSVVPLMMGQTGRYLEIMRAVLPDLVTVIMAAAPRSCAVVQVAWEIAEVTLGCSFSSRRLKRLFSRYPPPCVPQS